MNICIPRAACAAAVETPTKRSAIAPFWLGVAISALIWAALATGTTVSISSNPLSEQPQLALSH